MNKIKIFHFIWENLTRSHAEQEMMLALFAYIVTKCLNGNIYGGCERLVTGSTCILLETCF